MTDSASSPQDARLRQSEAALRFSEARYQRLLETALEGILFLDVDGRISHVNRRFAQMLGYDSADALTDQPVFFLFFPEDEWRARDRWAARLQGTQEEYELRLRRQDGAACWVIAHVSIERDETTGAFLGTFTMFTDITERRRIQQELAVKSQEVVTIFERVADAFAAFDLEWRFTYVNHEAERILGKSSAALLGTCLWEEFEGTRDTAMYAEYLRAQQEQVPTSFEVYYGQFLGWFEVRAYPSPTGLSAYFRNISERKAAEAERERAAQEKARLVAELQEANERQRRFLREMLFGFTDGRLRLCDAVSDLPDPLPPLSEALALTAPTLRVLRRQVEAVAEGVQLPKERLQDLETAVGEAAMNAVRYAGGGTARIHGNVATGMLQVWVTDQGPGIADDLIHRAIEQGWTTDGFGQGFFFMRSCADRVYLLTGPGGTTLVLEQEHTPPKPAWIQGLEV